MGGCSECNFNHSGVWEKSEKKFTLKAGIGSFFMVSKFT